MTTIQTIVLTQGNWQIPAVVHAVQYDTGRRLRMVIGDAVITSGTTANLSIERSDGSHNSIPCTLSSDGAFECDMTQALTQAGETKCQLQISGIVSSYTFVIEVQASVNGTPTAQEGYTIADAIDQADNAVETANAAVASAQSAQQTVEQVLDGLETITAGVITDISDGVIYIGDFKKESE